MDKFAGFTIRKANEDNPAGISIAIYGKPGVGKTTLAAQASLCAEGGRTLILDAEGGARSISHLDNVDIIDITSWQQLAQISNELMNPNVSIPWGTIILDNMSEYQAIGINALAGRENPQLQMYLKNTNEMLYLTRAYRDMARKRGVNVFFIAWESPEKDEFTGITKHDMGFTPSLARQFPGIIDIVIFLTSENDPPQFTRVISFAPAPNTAAKFRRSRAEVAKDIPLVLYYTQDETPMVDLLATLKGGKAWPTGKYVYRRTQANTTTQGQNK